MASHRKPRTNPLSGPAARTAATMAAAAAASVGILAQAQPGHAAPRPTPQQVKAQVDALYQQAEKATQDYDGAAERTAELTRQASNLQDQAARTDSRLNDLRTRLGQVAAAQYATGTMDPQLQLLMSAHPDDYLRQAGTLQQVSAAEAELMRQYSSQATTLHAQEAAARAKLVQLQAEQRRLAAAKATIQAGLAAAQQLLATLDAEARQTLQAASAGGSPQTQVPAQGGSTQGGSAPVVNVPVSGRAAAAVAFARAQLGKPYVWGATGPNSFDCSGLTQAAWRAAGVSLPRTTYEQINAGTRIAVSQLQPGDLVFYYAGVSHVAIYVGGGEIIHAPHPGASVEYAPLHEMPISGAVRP
ncbi:C40 family peptidase [Streptacidiphilus monticola]|uniref:NlpC/P60 family protein n=1 Tax=Streptacidiphilus monticola TaxID=2161674 RepID=A0ABW1FYF0_9ACTN